MRIPECDRKKFEKIMAEIFPNLSEYVHLQIQEAKQNSSRIYIERE